MPSDPPQIARQDVIELRGESEIDGVVFEKFLVGKDAEAVGADGREETEESLVGTDLLTGVAEGDEEAETLPHRAAVVACRSPARHLLDDTLCCGEVGGISLVIPAVIRFGREDGAVGLNHHRDGDGEIHFRPLRIDDVIGEIGCQCLVASRKTGGGVGMLVDDNIRDAEVLVLRPTFRRTKQQQQRQERPVPATMEKNMCRSIHECDL